MLLSQLLTTQGFPQVQHFIVALLDMQFSDVRAMLQLPRPDIGITPGCNFAITATLCNLLSGISTTIYKPVHLLHENQSNYRSGDAFQNLIQDFFPYTPPGTSNFPAELYQSCRNPLAHAVGLQNASSIPGPGLLRVYDPSHPNRGWSSAQLDAFEQQGEGYRMHPGIVVTSSGLTVHCDSFYLDVINLMRRLTSNTQQIEAAERRFTASCHNWRR